jgi:hypothetical protein
MGSSRNCIRDRGPPAFLTVQGKNLLWEGYFSLDSRERKPAVFTEAFFHFLKFRFLRCYLNNVHNIEFQISPDLLVTMVLTCQSTPTTLCINLACKIHWHKGFVLVTKQYMNIALGHHPHYKQPALWRHFSFRSPYFFYRLTVGVEVVYFHFITLTHTHHSR